MGCRTIKSPITGEQITSDTWNGILGEVGNEQLADKLYAQLNTPAFKEWFGDWTTGDRETTSKVVTPNGEPLLLFHSSTKEFAAFDRKFSQEVGFHFGTEQSALERHSPWAISDEEGYGKGSFNTILKDARASLKQEIDDFTIYPVFLNVRNMIEGVDYLDAEQNEEMSQMEYDYLYLKGRKAFKDEMIKLVIAFHQKGTITYDQVLDIFAKKLTLQEALNADGYWYINKLEAQGEISYVVFDENNIKSIFNNGEYSLKTNDIYYNLSLLKSQQKFASIPEAVLFNLGKNGLVNKFNPDDTIMEDRWYFNQSKGLENSQRYYNMYMSINNLNKDMFIEDVTQSGVPYLKPNPTFKLNDTIEENNERIHKDKYETLIEFFISKFNIPREKINYITKKEFAERFPDKYKENAQSAYSGGNFYFFTNNLTADITVEELLHPFIFTVKELNKPLFDNLLKEAKKSYPKLHQKIQALYKDQTQSVRDQELVTQAMSRVFNNVYENEEPRSFVEIIKDFVSWMVGHLNEILRQFHTGKVINLSVEDLPPQTSMEQIAQLLNATDTKFDVMFPEGTFYNMSTDPKDFQEVVSILLSDRRIEAKIEEHLVRLPDTLKEIRRQLTTSVNDKEKKALGKVIKDIEELEGENKKDLLKSQIRGILTTIELFNTLNDELLTVERSEMDPNLKLTYYMSVYKTANALDGFKDIMLDLNKTLSTLRERSNRNVREFHLALSNAIKAKDVINHSVSQLVVAPLLEELVKNNESSYTPKLEALDRQISEIQAKIQATNSLAEKDKLQNKLAPLLKEKKSTLEKAPTKENLQKVFDGVFKDANLLSHIFEATIANGHPLVNTLQEIINNIYDTAGGNMVNSKNEMQTYLDEYLNAKGLSLRDMAKVYKDIGDDILRIPSLSFLDFDKDGQPQLSLDEQGNPIFNYIEQNALYQEVDNEYITKYLELELVKDYYLDQLRKDITNNVKNSPFVEKSKAAYKAFEEFKKENSQREYSEEYYAFRAMLDEEIGGRTVRQITGDIYNEISKLEDARDRADSANRASIIQALKEKKTELKKLRSEYNDDGTKKDEEGLRLVKILNEYTRLRFTYGDNVLTDEGETKYYFDLDNLEFRKDQYDPKVYKALLAQIQQTVISPDYFETLTGITDNINHLTNVLIEASENSDIAQYADKTENKQRKKDIYKELKDITKPYRDENQIIDGISLTAQNPDLVTRIKDLQQYVEDLKFESTKLYSLSPAETNELRELRKTKDKTEEQKERLTEILTKREAFKKFKKDNLATINELSSLFKELGDLSDTSTTEYYAEMTEMKLAEAKNDLDVIESAQEWVDSRNEILLANKQKYVKKDGKWYIREVIGKKITDVFLGDDTLPFDTGYNEMVNAVIDFLAEEKIRDTEWWANNHYIYYAYNRKTNSYVPVERPIYIWEHQTPVNPNYIEVKPAKEYEEYQVKDSYINEEGKKIPLINNDYKFIYRNVPMAKKGKFVNKKYAEIIKDPAKAKFLSFLTNKYENLQKIYPDSVKMGHVLPAIVKTEGENSVALTNKVVAFDGTFTEMFKTNAGETDTDTSYLLGGSQSNTKSIPMRFVGKMDTSQQTKNVAGSILLFEYHSALYQALNDQLPVFEAAQLLASKVDVIEKVNHIDKLGFVGKMRKMFSPSKDKEEQSQKKEIEKSVLSRSVDNILNVFVYGQRVKPEIINLGPLGNVDLAKVSQGILGFAAKTIFVGNIISALYNSLGTRLQAIVNSGIKSNLYTINNLKNAQAKVVKYTPDLLSDWTKLGNKSLIGQVLDHFSFLADNPGREITSKSEFTFVKNKMEFLTSAKQISEFEVLFLQFMTIADATTVKVNGVQTKLSEIEKIFEIKDGKFTIKDGVEFTPEQEKRFRNRFQSMARKLAGAYRDTEISSAETNWIGKSAFFLRRYFVSMATNRFAGERWSSQEQELQIGYHRQTFMNMIELFKDYKHLGLQQWSRMSDKDKVAFYKTTMEYGILFLLIGLLSLAGGDDDKKKLKENSWAYNLMLVTLYRAKTEMEQFTLKGVDDLIRTGKNPFMIFTTMGNVTKTVGLVAPTILGWESAYYQQNTGLHEKGDSKLVSTFLKLIGYTGATWNPEEYLVNFRNAQNR